MIDIALCTIRGGILLDKALASLLEQSIPANIILVDNSIDGSAFDRARLPTSNRQIVSAHEPAPGLSFARNKALELSKAEYIAFIDDDAEAEPDWLEQILVAFDQFGPQACAVGGPVFPRFEGKRPAWLGDEVLRMASCIDWGGELRVTKQNEYLVGCNLCYRTEALRRIGGFATKLGRVGQNALMGNEELDVIAKLIHSDMFTVYQPSAKVSHFVPQERLVKSWYRKRMAWQAISDMHMSGFNEQSSTSQIISYVASVPSAFRGLDVFSYDTEEQDQFREQLYALRAYMMWALSGYEQLEEMP
ncbi:MAG: glycosyltransferase [Bdellovibrionales bacterium]|nr:glycosyltransferase [Bdellovibrionales bacterium]